LKKLNRKDLIQQQVINETTNNVANSLLRCWQLYNNKNSYIVFLVEEKEEWTSPDQMLLELECNNIDGNVKTMRLKLQDIAQNAYLNEKKQLFYKDKEIAIVYFRCAYDPEHYTCQKVRFA
jgi:hypothetical protein